MRMHFAAFGALLALVAIPTLAHAQDEPGLNGDIAAIALLFSEDGAYSTPGAEFLDYKQLNYSLESLKHVNAYLEKVRTSKTLDADWQRICLRAGAYVGEVIRRAPGKTKFTWLDFESAKKISPEFFADGDDEFGVALVLYDGKDGFTFPLAKVQKFLINGSEDDLYSYASVIVSAFNQ